MLSCCEVEACEVIELRDIGQWSSSRDVFCFFAPSAMSSTLTGTSVILCWVRAHRDRSNEGWSTIKPRSFSWESAATQWFPPTVCRRLSHNRAGQEQEQMEVIIEIATVSAGTQDESYFEVSFRGERSDFQGI